MGKGLMFEGFWALCWAGFFVGWLFALLVFVVLLSACF
jgi:tetrahydromethanopterin S-methyltransferase subunit F